MPTVRTRLGLAAAPNGKLYAVGGLTGANSTALTTGEAVFLQGSANFTTGSEPTFTWDVGGGLFLNIDGQFPSPRSR